MGWIALLLGCSGVVLAQEQSGWSDEDSAKVAEIHAHILGHGSCYEDLRVLCKDVGARLSGSEEADAAILWGARTLEDIGAGTVRMQPVVVPHWERGASERAWLRVDGGVPEPLRISALGGSVGTEGTLEAEVMVFRDFDELDSLSDEGTPLDRHGNPNVLTHDLRTSSLSQSPAAHSARVDVRVWPDDETPPAVRAFEPPAFVKRK